MIYLDRYTTSWTEGNKRLAYETACDVIYMLGKRKDWNWRKFDITPKEAEEIWKLAKKDMKQIAA